MQSTSAYVFFKYIFLCYDFSQLVAEREDSMQVGVTIKKNASLNAVTEEQLQHSVYEMLSVLEIYATAHTDMAKQIRAVVSLIFLVNLNKSG